MGRARRITQTIVESTEDEHKKGGELGEVRPSAWFWSPSLYIITHRTRERGKWKRKVTVLHRKERMTWR